MISTVIFDLDGLLADTERLHCRAYQMALLEQGVELNETDYCEHWVRFGKGIADWVTLQKLDLDPHSLRLRKAEHYLDLLISSLRPMEGALELLDAIRGKMHLALASSSYRDAIDGVLAGLDIAHYFEVIVSGLDVAQVNLGVEPEQCLVVEDAEKGILAAHFAGMLSIAVPSDYTRHHDFSKATKVCASLKEITPELLQALGSGRGEAGIVRGRGAALARRSIK